MPKISCMKHVFLFCIFDGLTSGAQLTWKDCPHSRGSRFLEMVRTHPQELNSWISKATTQSPPPNHLLDGASHSGSPPTCLKLITRPVPQIPLGLFAGAHPHAVSPASPFPPPGIQSRPWLRFPLSVFLTDPGASLCGPDTATVRVDLENARKERPATDHVFRVPSTGNGQDRRIHGGRK